MDKKVFETCIRVVQEKLDKALELKQQEAKEVELAIFLKEATEILSALTEDALERVPF
jgi:DNA repair exonuclease SbcCD ATPase subunit